MLARKRTQGKLEYELEKIMKASVIIERPVMNITVVRTTVAKAVEKKGNIIIEVGKVEKQVEKTEKVLVNINGRIDYEKLNEKQKQLYDDNRDKYKEIRSWHEKMKLANTDEERAMYRNKVVELDDAIRDNWKAFDLSFEPSSPQNNGNDPKDIDQVKAVSNARAYLSKNIPKLEGLTGKKLDALKEKVAQRYGVIIEAKQAVDDETIAKLKAHGIIVE